MAEGAKVDLGAHERTYTRFLRLAKFGTMACAMVAIVVVLIISR